MQTRTKGEERSVSKKKKHPAKVGKSKKEKKCDESLLPSLGGFHNSKIKKIRVEMKKRGPAGADAKEEAKSRVHGRINP